MSVSLIAAVAANRVIGNKGTLPWRLPDDLARFKRLTMGHAVIMGHATFTSMGRPLPGRQNIVLTRNAALQIPGCDMRHSAAEALAAAEGREAFIIGGAAIYALFLPLADLMYLTLIDVDVPGETLFPDVRWEEWRVLSDTPGRVDSRSPLPHRFVDYERVTALPPRAAPLWP
jgi:dihydrofolate reductase